jgi:nicotinamidase-related amidase
MNERILSAGDVIIAFADLQEGIINVGATNGERRIRTAAAALTDLATAFGIPVVISCVATTSGTVAPVLNEITTRLRDAKPHVRTTANAMDDAPFRAALEATGRKTLVVAGVATEIAVRLVALAAKHDGFRPIIAVDACNGLDTRTESTTFMHLCNAGIELSAVATIAAQLAGDFGGELGQAAMRALQSTLLPHAHDHGPLGDLN